MYKKIMVPLDGSPLAECVLPHVEAIAKGCGASEIIFVSVIEAIEAVEAIVIAAGLKESARLHPDASSIDRIIETRAEAYLKKVISQMKSSRLNIRPEVIVGKSAAEVIIDYAARNSVDLIIMATHGRSGISRWVMGSVALRVSQAACVPVLMVRSPGCKVLA